MVSAKIRELARILWDYHTVQADTLADADLLLVTGSHDDRVAEYAAEIWKNISVNIIVTSGGSGKITAHTLSEPEGIRFKKIMVNCGVPKQEILVENEATNTGQNFTKSRDLLEKKA